MSFSRFKYDFIIKYFILSVNGHESEIHLHSRAVLGHVVRNLRKCTLAHVCPAKSQINLRNLSRERSAKTLIRLCGALAPRFFFSCSTQLSMKFFMLINLRLQTLRNSFSLNITEHENFPANKYENANYCWHFHIY